MLWRLGERQHRGKAHIGALKQLTPLRPGLLSERPGEQHPCRWPVAWIILLADFARIDL
ncbi:hypothetical protein D3C84_80150 [compost metagenome]